MCDGLTQTVNEYSLDDFFHFEFLCDMTNLTCDFIEKIF
jgi:hypothetical protein